MSNNFKGYFFSLFLIFILAAGAFFFAYSSIGLEQSETEKNTVKEIKKVHKKVEVAFSNYMTNKDPELKTKIYSFLTSEYTLVGFIIPKNKEQEKRIATLQKNIVTFGDSILYNDFEKENILKKHKVYIKSYNNFINQQ